MTEHEFVMRDEDTRKLIHAAWDARHAAVIIAGGKTRVGAAALAALAAHPDAPGVEPRVFPGCNIQTPYRHDIHAEVSSIASAASTGFSKILAVAVASKPGFTPCGSCMDLIFALGGPDCIVWTAKGEQGAFTREGFRAHELMPRYPTR